MSDQGRIEDARHKLPLRDLMQQYGDAPREGRWKSFKCPFCDKKGASVTEFRGRQWFKCFHTSCPSGTSQPRGAWDEVAYLAYKTNLSREEAFIAYMKEAGVWEAQEYSPSVMPGTRGRRRALPREKISTVKPTKPSPGGEAGETSTPDSPPTPTEVLPPSSAAETESDAPPDGPPNRDPQPPAGGASSLSDEEAPEGRRALQEFYRRLTLAPADVAACWAKRGLVPETCQDLRSNPRSNLAVLQELAREFPLEELLGCGLYTAGAGGNAQPNRQFYGWGIKGKRAKTERQDREGDFEWDWVEPILIPYFDELGELYHLRPHKGMLAGKSSQLYIPFPTAESQKSFETAIITEGEFKALALYQVLASLRPRDSATAAFGVCSIPGISSVKKGGGGWWIRDRLESWLKRSGARRVVVAFDNEEKGNPKLPSYKPDEWKRHETQAWARYLAEQLSKDGYDARVCVIPNEWRDANGKADWDGALAQLLKQSEKPDWAEDQQRIQRLWVEALKQSHPAGAFRQLGLFSPAAERIIARRVKVFSYEPRLPAAGDREKWIAKKLNAFLWECRRKPGRIPDPALAHLSYLHRRYREIGGGYYTLTPPRSKTNPKDGQNYRENWEDRLQRAKDARDQDAQWACELALQGVPEQFTDFFVKPYYILEKETGELRRLVRIFNVHGEETKLLDLDSESFSAPKPLRIWLGRNANVTWGAGERELNALQFDLASALAHKVVTEVPRFGWHEPTGIWFFADLAIAPDGTELEPDDQGIFWYEGKGFKLSDKDQEGEDFKQGSPRMHPLRQVKTEWLQEFETETAAVQAMFQDVSAGLCDALGGYDGFLSLAMMLAYGAAPELYRQHTSFPGLWLHGEQQQGKSSLARWLIRVWGFTKEAGVPLEGSSTVGLRIGMQQYSNLPLWVEEYQTGISKDLLNVVKNAFNREAPTKKTFGEPPRRVLAGLVISGVATSSDAQVRGRYPHVHVSSTRRRVQNFDWFQAYSSKFFFLGRHLLRNRKAYVEKFKQHLDEFMATPWLKSVPSRSRLVYGVAFAAFAAMAQLLESHHPKILEEYRTYLAAECERSSEQVRDHVDVTQFWQDLLAAWRMGAFGEGSDVRRFFRAVRCGITDHPPAAPNQGYWTQWRLALHPTAVLEVLEGHWRRVGRPPLLKRNDLLDQMSKYPYWVSGRYKTRFGPAGTCWAWLIDLDKHDLGYQPVSDEEYEASKRRADGLTVPEEDWEDPRCGELYGLLAAVKDQ